MLKASVRIEPLNAGAPKLSGSAGAELGVGEVGAQGRKAMTRLPGFYRVLLTSVSILRRAMNSRRIGRKKALLKHPIGDSASM
ncbi:hypothetical protein SAMCCGM7_pC0209 (plasmid) [Sinorhizobium americanum CCGM7]|nr:hypothetical protein SAMCCGM7_pC0209 [Sinorhizobium americanum CCGM7]